MKKNKKLILRTIIIATVLLAAYGVTNHSFALGVLGVIGLGAIFIYAAQLFMLAIGLIGQGIMSALTGSGASDIGGSVLGNIFFNKTPLTTAAFFTGNGNNLGLPDEGLWQSGDVMFNISQKVSQYYYVLRNLAIAILLFVLLYIAIRMATSTLSEREARYKKMLTNWAVSLALVFVLHYIMIVTFYVNNTLVSVLERTMGGDVSLDTGWLALEGLIPIQGFGEALIYMILMGMEITFLFMYIKRILVLSFLILIAPLITITYSIDKIGDGKSQALNTWLKEFVYNVIIQPFHCILYITLVKTAVESMTGGRSNYEGLGGFIIYILVLQFVKEAENIVKKIFNIQADSMPGMQGMGALALGAASTLGSLAKGSKSDGKSKKMPNMKDESGSKAAGAGAAVGAAAKAKLNGEKGAKKQGKPQGMPEITDADIKNAPDLKASGKGGKPKQGMDSIDIPGGPTGLVEKPSMPELSMPEITEQDYINGYNASKNAMKVESEPALTVASQSAAASSAATTAAENQSRLAKARAWLNDTSFAKGAEGAHKFFAGTDATPGDLLKNAAKAGVTLAGFSAGLGMGNMNEAIGLGMTAYGVSSKIDSAIDDYKSNVQLEENEDEYISKYAEYVEQYKTLVDPNATEDEIRENLAGLMDSYDEGSLNYSEIENETERELKRTFMTDTYSKMKKSYKVKGDDNASESVKALTQSKGSQKFRETYGE